MLIKLKPFFVAEWIIFSIGLCLSPGFAETFQMTRIKSLVPPSPELLSRVIEDKIIFDLQNSADGPMAHVSLSYAYSFNFNPTDQGWLVKDIVSGVETIEVDADLDQMEDNPDQGLIFSHENGIRCTLKGRIKKQGEENFVFYQRPAQINVELTYNKKKQEALLDLSVLWLEKVPDYGVFDASNGSGLHDILWGPVSLMNYSPVLTYSPQLRNRESQTAFPRLKKGPESLETSSIQQK